MKNTDIQKIRQLLETVKEWVCGDCGSDDCTTQKGCPYTYIFDKIDQALALLPCETCGGTKRVPSLYGLTQMHGTPKEMIESTKPCPDCQ